MSPEQAIHILTLATANLQATRQQHADIAMALQVLQGALPKPAPVTKIAETAKPQPAQKTKGE